MNKNTTADSSENPRFERVLSLFDAIGIVVCAMIGSGIFIVSSQVASSLQSGSLLLIAWVLAGAMTMIGAWGFSKLATACPEVGGQYAYLRHAWGDRVAFCYGWTQSFIIQPVSIAAVALGFTRFATLLFPVLNGALPQSFFALSFQKLLAAFLILILTLVNIHGVKGAVRIQNIITVINGLALLLIITTGLFHFKPALFWQNLSLPPSPLNWRFSQVSVDALVLGASLVGPLFALDGWNTVTFLAAEVKNPVRNLPLALLIGAGLTTLLYLLVNGAYVSNLTLNTIIHAPNGVVGATLMHAAFGPIGERIIAVMIMIAAFGCINSLILSGARTLYALANDFDRFKPAKALARLGTFSHVPETALGVQAACSIFLVFTRSFMELLDSMVFAVLFFYALAVAGLFIFKKRQLLSKVNLVLPVLYCLLCAWILLSLIWLKPTSAGLSIVISLFGLLLHRLIKHSARLPMPYPEALNYEIIGDKPNP